MLVLLMAGRDGRSVDARGRDGGPDDQDGDDDEREGEQHRAGGEGGPDLVGQQLAALEVGGTGRGEDGDQEAEPEGAAQLVGDVDHSAGRAGVLGSVRPRRRRR